MRKRDGQLSLSERMTIAIAFHLQGYRNFKTFYTEHGSPSVAAARIFVARSPSSKPSQDSPSISSARPPTLMRSGGASQGR
ncbi:MAG: hypothetical protein HC824_03980 [Synechococcales cyanobacterium RM1_1_8]|nr:hypothetical protein [Synechococcales cyanobacterium RM1_1_8]